MNRVEVIVIVEGQTEQTFVRDLLAEEMSNFGVDLRAALIGNPGSKGGDVRFDRAKMDIRKFLSQRQDTYVTIMFDYFRIDSRWPGCEKIEEILRSGCCLTAQDKAKIIEEETHEKIRQEFPDFSCNTRFLPYIEMHEFEALLFSDEKLLAENLSVSECIINAITEVYATPEEINTNPASAPSKRLLAMKPGYRKVVQGNAIAAKIGISRMRSRCPNFNKWIQNLIDIGPSKGN